MASNTPKASRQNDLSTRLKEAIETRVRPFIQMDGGDIEMLELTTENVLKIRLHGACVGCQASSMTIEYGVQNILFEEFPEEDIQLLLVQD